MNQAQEHTDRREGDWLQTYTGGRFFPLDPRPEDISIIDIAHHLSLVCRFGGAVRAFYSVAQHSVLVSENCPKEPLAGLLHDAAEAYIGDMVRGLKHSSALTGYRDIEQRIHAAIALRFDIPFDMPAEVKRADEVLLFTEARDLMAEPPNVWRNPAQPLTERIIPWTPSEAETQFLCRAEELGIDIDNP